jgi:hypothetical protein
VFEVELVITSIYALNVESTPTLQNPPAGRLLTPRKTSKGDIDPDSGSSTIPTHHPNYRYTLSLLQGDKCRQE